MTPPPPPVTQLTLVTDAHGAPVLVRFPDGTDLAPAALIARLAAAADCVAALGAARADAAALEARIQRLITEIEHRQRIDQEDMHQLQTDYDRVYWELAALKAERGTEDAATIAALRSALQRFVVPGHCDDVRRGVAQCGGVCRWCEAARALQAIERSSD